MKLSMWHGLGNLGMFSLLRCRSIHVVPTCDHIESLIHRREYSVAPAAVHPRWVMLNTSPRCRASVADGKTMADAGCATSTGGRLRISSVLEAPPASSVLYYDWARNAPSNEEEDKVSAKIITAHGDSVLLGISSRINGFWSRLEFDYYVYRASPARAPSLSLLPVRDFPMENESGRTVENPRERMMLEQTTGLLRRGDDELLVVELGLTYEDDGTPEDTAELCVLRVGGTEWESKCEVPIVLDKGSRGNKLQRWRFPNIAVPVGDRFLCWVNYIHGFLLLDMAEASPRLRYVPLPAAPFLEGSGSFSDDRWIEDRIKCSQNMCSVDGGGVGTVRLISVDPRCCCGSLVHARSACAHSRFTFTVTAWTVSLSMDKPMTWVKEGVLDCEELWALPGYEGLPRVLLERPVVSLDNPDVVCFVVRENNFVSSKDRKAWMIEVDTRRKALLSVICMPDPLAASSHVPAKLAC